MLPAPGFPEPREVPFCLAVSALLFLAAAISWMGCAASSVGIIPATPPAVSPASATCAGTIAYAQQLADAYRFRAAVNRDAIYGASLVGLLCTTGLGAEASQSNPDRTAISITAAACALLLGAAALTDNPALAGLYTVAANEDEAAMAKLTDCAALDAELAAVRARLELGRNGTAEAVLLRSLESRP